MMSDDGLEQFMADSGFMLTFLNAETFSKIRSWLNELMTARQYIPALEAQVERIKRLEEQTVALKRSVEFYFDRRVLAMNQRREALNDVKRLAAELQKAERKAEIYQHESEGNAELLKQALHRNTELQKQVDRIPWFARV